MVALGSRSNGHHFFVPFYFHYLQRRLEQANVHIRNTQVKKTNIPRLQVQNHKEGILFSFQGQ